MSTRAPRAAVLIVKNEAERLPTCLGSLTAVVDVVYVHDTGSSDDTIAVARAHGAMVSRGEWHDDFARARNEALQNVDADWVLSIDADERVTTATPMPFADAVDAYQIDIHVRSDEQSYTFPAVRWFRPDWAHWVGAVHEQIEAKGGTLRVSTLSPEAFVLTHDGYDTAGEREAKALRNAAVAQAVIASSPDGPALARAWVDLGRSRIAAGDAQGAADAFEHVRSAFPGSEEFREATDFFVRLLLAEDMANDALAVTQQLLEAGAESAYCDWLAAQALVPLGRWNEALALLHPLTEVRDTMGRRYDDALTELRSLVTQLVAGSRA